MDKTDRPLISVVIPAYNSEKFIEETLRSVMIQSHKNIEIIVVDDGSTDGQKEKISRLAENDSRIQYIYQENQGVSAARNRGFAQSKGTYLAFLDSDDVWLHDNLESKLVKIESGHYGLVHSDGFVMNENSYPTGQIISGNEGMLLDDLLALKDTQVPGPSSILVKREVVETVGLFDQQLSTSADHEFFVRVAARFRIGRLPKPTWSYRIHPFNMHKRIALMEKDFLYEFQKASSNHFFKNKSFERKCYANMYLILAASWAKDGQNIRRGLYFTILALKSHPVAVTNISKRILKKWF